MGIRDKPIAPASPLAERLCRTDYRIDPARMLGPSHRLGRDTFASNSKILRRLLQRRQNASVLAQGCADLSSDSTDRNHSFTPDPRRASPSLRPDLIFRYTQPFIARETRGHSLLLGPSETDILLPSRVTPI